MSQTFKLGSYMHFIGALLFVVLFTGSVLERRAHILSLDAERKTDIALRSAHELDIQQELGAAHKAAEAPFARAEDAERLFWAYRRLAGSEHDTRSQVGLYCRALSHLGSALARAPKHGTYLAYWADLRELLGDITCSLPYTSGDPFRAGQQAAEFEPVSTNVSFIVGSTMLAAGKGSEALRYFSNVILYSSRLSPLRRQAIFDAIKSEDDLLAVIPERFPQAIEWSNFFRREAEEKRNDHWAEAFEKILFGSFEELRAKHLSGTLTTEDFLPRLTQYVDVFSIPEKRAAVDAELSNTLRRISNNLGSNSLTDVADYFALRSKVDFVPVIGAITLEDTRPEKQGLYLFDFAGDVQFQEFPHSIGFAVTDRHQIGSIELQFPAGALRNFSANRLRVFYSDDNRTFREGRQELDWQEIEFLGQRIFHSPLTIPAQARFVKITIDREVTDPPMRVNLNNMLNVWSKPLANQSPDDRSSQGVQSR
jgi:hypothetical protein